LAVERRYARVTGESEANMRNLASLPRAERLQLLEFVCSFVWADLAVGRAERGFVEKLMRQAHLHADEAALVRGWLETPPPVDDLDPNRIPLAHRKLFVEAMREAVAADGVIAEAERDTLRTFEDLLN
jgi:uncharacterized tellurite resistance protein B-like protein